MSDEITTEVIDQEQLPVEQEVAEVATESEEAKDEVKNGDKPNEPDEPKKSRTQERFDTLTRQKNEAVRETEYWRNKAESSDGNRRELAEHEAEKAETKVAAINAESWQAKVESARNDMPDYDEVVGKSKAHVAQHVGDAVLESDIGPQLFHHFARNPEVLEKLNGMTEKQALKEIGKLEATLETQKQTAPAFKKSGAPDPIQPVSSNRGVTQKSEADMTFDEYEAHRRKGGAVWAKR